MTKTITAANLSKLLDFRAPGKTFEIKVSGDTATVTYTAKNGQRFGAPISLKSAVDAASQVQAYLARLG